MVNGAGQLDHMRRSRMSLVILAISLAGLYYSTQVSLNHSVYWWVWVMAIASTLLFCGGLIMSYFDWQGENQLRNQLRELWRAETSRLDQEIENGEETEPADMAKESDSVPFTNWGDLIR